jgi:hypothetical protein
VEEGLWEVAEPQSQRWRLKKRGKRKNLLCQLYSMTRPLILSLKCVSIIHFLYLSYSLFFLSWIFALVAAN